MLVATLMWATGRLLDHLGDLFARYAQNRIDHGWGGRLWLS